MVVSKTNREIVMISNFRVIFTKREDKRDGPFIPPKISLTTYSYPSSFPTTQQQPLTHAFLVRQSRAYLPLSLRDLFPTTAVLYQAPHGQSQRPGRNRSFLQYHAT